jgi:hypothetical protein
VTALTDTPSWHAQLAVGPLAQRARVLALDPHRAGAVLGEAGVVDHPCRRRQSGDQPLGQPPADRPPVPGGHGDEVVQRLVVHLAEPGGHRPDRLAAALQQQPAQVALPAGALIGALQRGEEVVGEPFQAVTDGGQLGRCDAPHGVSLARTGRTAPSHPTHQPPT